MFVLFLSFVFLRISVCRTTENKNAPLKNQLQKSLTHVNDMLADIEGKIEHERKLLSQIDYDLNHKEHPSFMDYEVTDIWWATSHTADPRTSHHPTEVPPEDQTFRPGELLPDPAHTSPTTVLTIFTTPTLFPKPLPSTFPTRPPGWPFPPTPGTENLFIQDMKKTMEIDQNGYGSAFVAKLMELVATKRTENVIPLIYAMTAGIEKLLDEGKFAGLDVSLTDGMKMWLDIISFMRPSLLQQQAGTAHFVMKNKKALLSKEINSAIDYYDRLFTKEEGEELFATLELFERYPDGKQYSSIIATIKNQGVFVVNVYRGKSAVEVSQSMLSAVMAPFMQIAGTRKQKRFIQLIHQAIQELDPYWRGRPVEDSYTVASQVNKVATDQNHTAIPKRRVISYKNIVKHFVVKHPQLLKQIKNTRHHNNHNQKSGRRHKQRRHHNYRKNREKRERHARFYEREHIRQRPYRESNKELENKANDADTSGSSAYYHEHTSASQRNNEKNLHKIQRMKNRLKKLKHYRYLKSKRRQRNLLYRTRVTTKSPLTNQAINFNKKKQRSRNFRRFIISSSGENNSNSSEYFDLSTENHNLHKIIEASSYSDEEDHLRNNLYDALRHGNKTYVKFRAADIYNNHNQSLRHSSTETDDEWVLKNNIYRVFEQKK